MIARARRVSRPRQGVVAGADPGEHVAGEGLEGVGDRDALGLPGQLARPPGDPRGEVGDPLPVAADLQHGGQPAQVRGDRLVEGQDPQAFLLDPHLLAVGLLLGVLDLGDDIQPAVADRVDPQGQRIDDGPGHREEFVPEDLLVPHRVPDGGRCRRSG